MGRTDTAVRISASPDRVFAALTDPDALCPGPLSEAQTGHRSPPPLRYTMRAPGSPPVARLVRTKSGSEVERPSRTLASQALEQRMSARRPVAQRRISASWRRTYNAGSNLISLRPGKGAGTGAASCELRESRDRQHCVHRASSFMTVRPEEGREGGREGDKRLDSGAGSRQRAVREEDGVLPPRLTTQRRETGRFRRA
jgi:hypothetical protein